MITNSTTMEGYELSFSDNISYGWHQVQISML